MLSFARADASQALYAPAASVSLGADGRDMLHVHGLAATSVEVDLPLGAAGQFKFTIPNTFDAARADFLTAYGQPALPLLKLGTRVWIRMGYGDRSRQALILAGYITAVGTSFTEGSSPDLEVSGHDALYPLTLGSRARTIKEGGVKAAVNQVAADYRLSPDLNGDPPDVEDLESNLQSDMQFLIKLAEKFAKSPKGKWEFYARAEPAKDILRFSPRSLAEQVAVLKWGADLLSFKPEANLGNQISRVEVHGWDEVRKKAILGEARAESAEGKTPGELQQGFLPQEVVRQLRLPVRSKEEADARAAAELANTLNEHLKGEGETFGLPALLPDTRVRLDGLGAKFSRSFYVTKTTHRYDSSGYRTRFSIEEPDS